MPWLHVPDPPRDRSTPRVLFALPRDAREAIQQVTEAAHTEPHDRMDTLAKQREHLERALARSHDALARQEQNAHEYRRDADLMEEAYERFLDLIRHANGGA